VYNEGKKTMNQVFFPGPGSLNHVPSRCFPAFLIRFLEIKDISRCRYHLDERFRVLSHLTLAIGVGSIKGCSILKRNFRILCYTGFGKGKMCLFRDSRSKSQNYQMSFDLNNLLRQEGSKKCIALVFWTILFRVSQKFQLMVIPKRYDVKEFTKSVVYLVNQKFKYRNSIDTSPYTDPCIMICISADGCIL
jgi:hypothetical protein